MKIFYGGLPYSVGILYQGLIDFLNNSKLNLIVESGDKFLFILLRFLSDNDDRYKMQDYS
jgi:hypothetical protein